LPAQLDELGTAMEADNARCGMLAHTIKGTAAVLGTMALSNAASQLETHCKDHAAVAQRQAALLALQGVAAESLLQLQALVDTWAVQQPALGGDVEGTPDAATGLELQALSTALRKLTVLLDANDLTALEDFANLRGSMGSIPLALVEPLENALQDLDLAEASERCRAIETWLEVPAL
jgi:HPt (histidine-containing phosphotransfer) domain-containing protein